MTDIKSCPHCGGSAALEQVYSRNYHKWFVKVACNICGAAGKVVSDRDDPAENDWHTAGCYQAIEAWNMRQNERSVIT